MNAPLAGLRTQLASAVRPRTFLRSAAAAVITMVAAPLLVMVPLLILGFMTGPGIPEEYAFEWMAGVVGILTAVTVVVMLIGIVAVARVQRGDGTWRALWNAIRVLPRLVVALVGALILAGIAAVAWPLLSVGGLATAFVLRMRRAPRVRTALLLGVPFVPFLGALMLLPAALSAAADRPRSLRALAVAAVQTVGRKPLAVLLGTVVAAAASLGLGTLGVQGSIRLDAAEQPGLSLVLVGLSLAAVLLVIGTVAAIIRPGTSESASAQASPPSSPPSAGRGRLFARVATLVIVSLLATAIPGAISSPASASSENAVSVSTVSESAVPEPASPESASLEPASPANADALLQPQLLLGFDGEGPSPTLYAEVRVEGADPAGSVQFFNGATPVGEPQRVETTGWDSALADVFFSGMPALDPGLHEFTFQYTPDNPAVAPAVSEPMPWSIVATTVIALSARPGDTAGGPVEVTAALTADYATSVRPKGSLRFEFDGTSRDVALVDGVAVLSLDRLDDPWIDVFYDGSPEFHPEQGTISVGSVEPTEITVQLFNAPHAFGREILVVPTVKAPGAPYNTTVPGDVRVYSGDRLLVERSLDEILAVPTETLGLGDHLLRFEFVPGYGFAASEVSVVATVVKASTSATASLSPDDGAWGTARTLTVRVESTLDGPRTVEVRDTITDTVIATQQVEIAGGAGSAAIDLSVLLRPGTFTLVATVLGDDDREAATTRAMSASVAWAATSTTLSFSTNPVQLRDPVTLTAVVSAAPGLPYPTGQVTFLLPNSGSLRAPVIDGVATTVWTPTELVYGESPVSASYADSTHAFASSSDTAPVSVIPASVSAPTVEWSGTLTPSDRTVTLSYAAKPGQAVPTGVVQIVDEAGHDFVRAWLDADGSVTMAIAGTIGDRPVLRANYLGDSTYGARSDLLPVDDLVHYAPRVSLTAPGTVDLGVPFRVAVEVGDVPLGTVRTVTVMNGETAIATVELDRGTGSAQVNLLREGPHALTAVVDFTPASLQPSATSDVASVVVAPVPVPQLTLITTTPVEQLAPTGSAEILLTAEVLPNGTTGIASGTIAEVRDDAGRVVGTVTLRGSGPGSTLTGTMQLTQLKSGPLRLTASVIYGPLDATATSGVLELPVPPADTWLALEAPGVTVGSPHVVTVTATPVQQFEGDARSVDAEVTVGNVTQQITLTRPGSTGGFVGTATFPTASAGPVTITASTRGDGVEVGPASVTVESSVARRGTSMLASIERGTSAGEDVVIRARIVQDGVGVSPAPTGPITVTNGFTSCVIVDELCTIPGEFVRDGVNTFTAFWDGDSQNTASSTAASFTAGPRTSVLDVSYSPAIGEWIYGEPVTVTWTTTTSGRDARGTASVAIDRATCQGPAAAGSCTVTPSTAATRAPVDMDYRVTFFPSDDAPGAEVSGTAAAHLCANVRALGGAVDAGDAVRCGPAGAGVRTGSTVTLSGTPQEHHVVDAWQLDGTTVATGATPKVTIDRTVAMYTFTQRYAPTCYTLTTGPTAEQAAELGGTINVHTRPNCSDPRTPSAAELEAAKAGVHQFAAGTSVHFGAVPARPELSVDAVAGASLNPAGAGEVVMNQDRSISATFKVSACIPVTIAAGEGGTVELLAATRPTATAGLLPATGACSASDGRAGYVPGTTLRLEATPDAEAAMHDWVTGTRPFEKGSLKAVPAGTGHETGASAATPAAATREFVVPGEGALHVGARFALSKCVSVTVISRTMVTAGAWANHNLPAGAHSTPHGTETGCDGVESTSTVTFSGSRRYRILAETTSYAASGRVHVETTQPGYRPAGLPEGVGLGGAAVVWSTSTTEGVQRITRDGSGGFTDATLSADQQFADRGSMWGPIISLSDAPAAVTVRADWVFTSADDCHAPRVDTPQGSVYTLERVHADEPFCEEPDKVGYGQQLTLRSPVVSGMTAFLTHSGGHSQNVPAAIYGQNSYTLEYCVPLGLEVRIIDDKGAARPADAAEIAMVLDDGGCPSGWTRPGRTVKTALSEGGAVNHTVVGNPDGFGPERTFAADGTASGPTRMDLKVICFTLHVDDASITTKSNCPGGAANRFLRGSQVEVQAGSGDRFDGWEGVDAAIGETAWVVMHADRSVEADLHDYAWYEHLANALTSVVQRVIAAVVSVAMAVILAEVFIVKAAGYVLKGTAALLNAAGVSGAAVDGIDKAGDVIGASFDGVEALGNCLSSVATGGAPDLLSIPASGTTPRNGGTIDSTINNAKNDLVQMVNSKSGVSTPTIPLGSLFEEHGIVYNIFGSGTSMYTADAKNSWSEYGNNIKSCATQKAKDLNKKMF